MLRHASITSGHLGANGQPPAGGVSWPPVSSAMQAPLMPSYDLARVAATRTVTAGAPLRDLAHHLRAPLCAPGGVFTVECDNAAVRCLQPRDDPQ